MSWLRTPSWRGCRKAAKLARELATFDAVFTKDERHIFKAVAENLEEAYARLLKYVAAHPVRPGRRLFQRERMSEEARLADSLKRMEPGCWYTSRNLAALWGSTLVLTKTVIETLRLRGDILYAHNKYARKGGL